MSSPQKITDEQLKEELIIVAEGKNTLKQIAVAMAFQSVNYTDAETH